MAEVTGVWIFSTKSPC